MSPVLNYEESNVKQKKRQEILDKAMNIFIREGIHAVSMKDIAYEIGISLRSLYYYYASKNDLAVDIQIVAMSRFGAFLEPLHVNPDHNAYENLVEVMRHLVVEVLANQKVIKYITAFDFHFFNQYPSPKYNAFLNTFKQQNVLLELVQMAQTDGSIDTHGYPVIEVFTTLFQSFLAYAQKIIYREKAMRSEDITASGNLPLFVEMHLNALKKR